MAGIIHYTECPVCGSGDLAFVLTAKDHTVSGDSFSIYECGACSLRITQDAPDQESIPAYYQSEEYISHSDSSKGFTNKLYQQVRKRTVRNKRRLIEKESQLALGSILDIGSGTGSFLQQMKKQGWTVKGLEPDAGARGMAKKLYGLELEDDQKLFELSAEQFDVITLWHVLEHVHDLHNYLRQIRTVLKTEGIIVIAVPNYISKDAFVYKECWAAYDVPRHLYHFSPRAMKRLMDKHDLKITDVKPMWYDSFYVSLLSSKCKTGRTNIISGFWNGMTSNLKAWGNVKRCSSLIYIIRK